MILRKRIAKISILIISLFTILTMQGCWRTGVIQYKRDIKALVYNDKAYYYVPIPGDRVCQYTSSKYLGKADDGQRVYNVALTTQFLCTRTWDGSPALYAENPEDVFTTGNATGVYVKKAYTNAAEAANLFISLFNTPGEIFRHNNSDSKSVSIYICYDELPIATVWLGEIAVINDVWVYISSKEIGRYLNLHLKNRDYDEISGVVISDENVIQSIKPYVKKYF